jgi:hypothetical protein
MLLINVPVVISNISNDDDCDNYHVITKSIISSDRIYVCKKIIFTGIIIPDIADQTSYAIVKSVDEFADTQRVYYTDDVIIKSTNGNINEYLFLDDLCKMVYNVNDKWIYEDSMLEMQSDGMSGGCCCSSIS